MPQYVFPKKAYMPEVQTKEERLRLKIHPKEKNQYTGWGVQGYFRPATGDIFLGTFEDVTEEVLWHEQMHKILYELLDLENPFKVTVQWDNISKDLEKFLFGMDFDKWIHYNYQEAVKAFGSEEAYLKFIGVK